MATLVDLILEDHLAVDKLFSELESEKDATKRLEIARQIFHELEVHTEIEMKLLYPTFEKEVQKKSEETATHAHHAHEELAEMIEELKKSSVTEAENSGWMKKMETLKDKLHEHNREEETDILPLMKDQISFDKLSELRKEALAIKEANTPAEKGSKAEAESLKEESKEEVKDVDDKLTELSNAGEARLEEKGMSKADTTGEEAKDKPAEASSEVPEDSEKGADDDENITGKKRGRKSLGGKKNETKSARAYENGRNLSASWYHLFGNEGL